MERHPDRPKVGGVYRIVHIDNLPDIIERGLFAATHPDRAKDYRFIGNKKLTAQRKTYTVKLPDGGELGDYVPFYFGRQSIMLLNIKTGYNVDPVPQNEIIYLLCKIDSLDAAGCEYCFTDGHAKSFQTKFFKARTDLDKVDWSIVNSRNWRNTEEDRDRQRRKQAEFMVLNHVPPVAIDHIVTFDADSLAAVEQIVLNSEQEIKASINPGGKLYY